MSNEQMGDEEFLRYCALHAQTPRALFHRDMVVRLYKLAGTRMLVTIPEFVAMHSDLVDPLVEKARARMNQTPAPSRSGAEFQQTLVIKRDNPHYPKIVTIAIVAQSLSLGVIMNTGTDGLLTAVRLPHPPAVANEILRLAMAWDVAAARIAALKAGETVVEDDPDTRFAIYADEGKVWLSFGSPTDGVGLEPEEAERVAEGMLKLAEDARAGVSTKGVADDGSGPIEA